MASLTPGILHKLLQNVGNKDFKVAGEHRSALLQVISIVPSLEDDPWKSRGYFLRVSDSLHSAYVSVSDEDVDLILSDKIQLGQFIHVARLDSGSPVPMIRGVKPVPKRRPCVGEPKDLISSDFLNAKKVESKVKLNGKVKKAMGSKEGSVRRLSMGNGEMGGLENRRLSLDSSRKAWDRSPRRKTGANGVPVNPKAKDISSRSSPHSISDGQGVKAKSKTGSLCSDSAVANKVFLSNSPTTPTISPLKSKNIVVSPKVLTKPVRSPVQQKPKPPVEESLSNQFNKVVVSPKICSEPKITWSSLPSAVTELGKSVRSYGDAAFVTAIRALEEASMYESVIHCMSTFAELCESSQKDSSGPLVEKYLNLHESMKKTAVVICNLMNARISDTKGSPQVNCLSPVSKNASLWVQAAVETDLSRFSLYAEGEKIAEKRHYVVIESTTETMDRKIISPKNNGSRKSMSKLNSKKHISAQKGMNVIQEAWSPDLGLKNVSVLAEKLLLSSRAWFLDYVENCLKNGFGLTERSKDSCNILGQLKHVNQWFDDAFQGGGGADERNRIERLRKKLYGFLLDHVDSAASSRK